MAELSTGNLSLSYGWDSGEDGWAGGYNTNIKKFDGLIFPSIQEAFVDTPEPVPSQGQMWLVGSTPTGAWAGWSNRLAYWDGAGWLSFTPKENWTIFDLSNNGQALTYRAGSWEPDLSFFGVLPVTQPANANQDIVTMTNADGNFTTISAAISATYVQTEVQAIADECEVLADDVRNIATLQDELRTALVDLGLIKGGV